MTIDGLPGRTHLKVWTPSVTLHLPDMRILRASWRHAMGYDRAAPKRPVNMTLNEDLVRRARGITPNLSDTVENLLVAFVDEAEAKAADREKQIAEHIAANDASIAKHGSLADEFSGL
jgi:antitoxin CcdA